MKEYNYPRLPTCIYMYNIVLNSEKDIFLTNEMYANEAYLAILVMMQAIRAYSLDFVTTSSFANLV